MKIVYQDIFILIRFLIIKNGYDSINALMFVWDLFGDYLQDWLFIIFIK